MSKYVTRDGSTVNSVEAFTAQLDMIPRADGSGPVIRSLWADLLTAKAAADKAIALAVEGLALVDKLQAENACLRVEIADADQRIIELDAEVARLDEHVTFSLSCARALASGGRIELVK